MGPYAFLHPSPLGSTTLQRIIFLLKIPDKIYQESTTPLPLNLTSTQSVNQPPFPEQDLFGPEASKKLVRTHYGSQSVGFWGIHGIFDFFNLGVFVISKYHLKHLF